MARQLCHIPDWHSILAYFKRCGELCGNHSDDIIEYSAAIKAGKTVSAFSEYLRSISYYRDYESFQDNFHQSIDILKTIPPNEDYEFIVELMMKLVIIAAKDTFLSWATHMAPMIKMSTKTEHYAEIRTVPVDIVLADAKLCLNEIGYETPFTEAVLFVIEKLHELINKIE